VEFRLSVYIKQLKLLFIIFALCSIVAFADDGSVLPKSFAGWRMQDAGKRSSDPIDADKANAAVLKEYGFTGFQSATYTREDGRKLALKAATFADATGAFGAFTFYNQPEMQRESIGDQGSSFNQRILFYRGNLLVDAIFDRVTAMSAAELRELAGGLPRPKGNANNLPPVLTYMPRKDYIRNTEKYVVGPLALAHVGSPLPANLVDFNQGTEVVLGRYQVSGGEATLMVISYPTPQIATEHMKVIDGTRTTAQQQPGEAPIVNVGPFYDKRSGPLLAIASGPLSQSDARTLLGAVNYDADVTWNQNTSFDKRNNLANLLVNIILLCGILMGLALVAGLAFGGLRIAFNRLLPGKLFKSPEEVEFISLHLDAGVSSPPDSGLSPSIKAG
jgi:hypothetical protein